MGNITVTADKKSSANNRTTNLSPNVAKLVDVDPRSPTEGIVRTPIILDKSSKKGIFQRNCTPCMLFVASAGRLPFDSPDFESIDGCITEDDSLHHNGNASSLSESVLPSGGNSGICICHLIISLLFCLNTCIYFASALNY